jgi:hypothetical protein
VSTANAPDHLHAEFLQMQVQRMNNTAKVEVDARFDGLFVLGTNTKLAALRVPLRYRNLLAEKQAPPGTPPHRAQTHRSRCGRAVAEQEGTRTALRLGEDFMSFERFGCAISSSRRCRTGGEEIMAISIHR